MRNLIIKVTLLLGIMSGMSLVPLTANAAINCTKSDLSAKQQLQCGSCQAAGTEANCTPDAAPKTLSDTIAAIINLLSIFGGAIAVIMIIVGGFRYITSGGNAESTKGARNTIVYAVIGLIIIAMAQIIVHFVLNNVAND
jgi:beta-lactamase regulating signal transducer with metallopeptidase domain